MAFGMEKIPGLGPLGTAYNIYKGYKGFKEGGIGGAIKEVSGYNMAKSLFGKKSYNRKYGAMLNAAVKEFTPTIESFQTDILNLENNLSRGGNRAILSKAGLGDLQSMFESLQSMKTSLGHHGSIPQGFENIRNIVEAMNVMGGKIREGLKSLERIGGGKVPEFSREISFPKGKSPESDREMSFPRFGIPGSESLSMQIPELKTTTEIGGPSPFATETGRFPVITTQSPGRERILSKRKKYIQHSPNL